MSNFIVERITKDGEIKKIGEVYKGQNLLNDDDLAVIAQMAKDGRRGRKKGFVYIASGMCDDENKVMVRSYFDVKSAYYKVGDKWCYGTMDDVLNTLKTRM